MSHVEQRDPSQKEKKKKPSPLPIYKEAQDEERAVGIGRFPPWLHRQLPQGSGLWQTKKIVKNYHLNTVCEEASCPNLLECWSKKTATFLIMGKECTRACGFCDIDFSKKPQPLNEDEPGRVAETAHILNLRHVVITQVARDDLPDGGAHNMAKTVKAIREKNPQASIEVLTSDYSGNLDSLRVVLESKPDVFNHNIETVRRLTPKVRNRATYERTLTVLVFAKNFSPSIEIKSGFMVGLGETEEEVFETMRDLKSSGVKLVTIGQYLQPSRHKLTVKEFIHPTLFQTYQSYGESLSLKVFAGPFVRSSYHAGDHYNGSLS